MLHFYIPAGTLFLDDKLPSLYNYKGIAYHRSQRLFDAENAFKSAVAHVVNDSRSWINLGKCLIILLNVEL